MTYSVREISEKLGVGEHTVLHWIARHELKAINVGREPGKKKPRWRISESSLADFELARTNTPPLPRTRRRPSTPDNIVKYY